jgi:uncharacterized membrane protein
MKLNEIIIIIVSVLFLSLIPIHKSTRIGHGVKKIIGVLYVIFALVSMILSLLEHARLKKSINRKTATFEERNANDSDRIKSGGLALLGIILIFMGIAFIIINK